MELGGEDAAGQRLGVVRANQCECPAIGLGQTAVVRGDDTAPGVLRLDGEDAEGLVPVLAVGRHDHDVVLCEQRGHAGWRTTRRYQVEARVRGEHSLNDRAVWLVGSRARHGDRDPGALEQVSVEHGDR